MVDFRARLELERAVSDAMEFVCEDWSDGSGKMNERDLFALVAAWLLLAPRRRHRRRRRIRRRPMCGKGLKCWFVAVWLALALLIRRELRPPPKNGGT